MDYGHLYGSDGLIKSLESTIPKDMDEVLMKYIQEKEEELEPLTTTVFLEKQMTGRYIAHGPQIALIKQSGVKVT
ncbi:hypothetical protein M3231_17575 [Neobacillus mesonae]|nr:hypothetical protein [Neobacillus mesonae]